MTKSVPSRCPGALSEGGKSRAVVLGGGARRRGGPKLAVARVTWGAGSQQEFGSSWEPGAALGGKSLGKLHESPWALLTTLCPACHSLLLSHNLAHIHTHPKTMHTSSSGAWDCCKVCQTSSSGCQVFAFSLFSLGRAILSQAGPGDGMKGERGLFCIPPGTGMVPKLGFASLEAPAEGEAVAPHSDFKAVLMEASTTGCRLGRPHQELELPRDALAGREQGLAHPQHAHRQGAGRPGSSCQPLTGHLLCSQASSAVGSLLLANSRPGFNCLCRSVSGKAASVSPSLSASLSLSLLFVSSARTLIAPYEVLTGFVSGRSFSLLPSLA